MAGENIKNPVLDLFIFSDYNLQVYRRKGRLHGVLLEAFWK